MYMLLSMSRSPSYLHLSDQDYYHCVTERSDPVMFIINEDSNPVIPARSVVLQFVFIAALRTAQFSTLFK